MITFLYIKHTWKRFHKILPLSGAAEKTPESPCPRPTLKQYIHLSFPLDRKQPPPPPNLGGKLLSKARLYNYHKFQTDKFMLTKFWAETKLWELGIIWKLFEDLSKSEHAISTLS